METREGKAWNIFRFQLVAGGTFQFLVGVGGYTLADVHEYTLRQLRRGDIRTTNADLQERLIQGWSECTPEDLAYACYDSAQTSLASGFGVYEYEKIGDPEEELTRLAPHICEEVAELQKWEFTPKPSIFSHREDGEVSQGVVNMRIDLASASCGIPRLARPLGSGGSLLEDDDLVMENFEYLLSLQANLEVGSPDHREVSHLLHRVSLYRWSLYERIRSEGIHVESNPDLEHAGEAR